MRYTLRNKDKIKSAYSSKFVDRLVNSLDAAFNDKTLDIHRTNDKYDILTINDTGHTCGLIMFYIINIRYDVYKLAYKEVIN